MYLAVPQRILKPIASFFNVPHHPVFVCNIKQLEKRTWGVATVSYMMHDALEYGQLPGKISQHTFLNIAFDCIFQLSTVQGLEIYFQQSNINSLGSLVVNILQVSYRMGSYTILALWNPSCNYKVNFSRQLTEEVMQASSCSLAHATARGQCDISAQQLCPVLPVSVQIGR